MFLSDTKLGWIKKLKPSKDLTVQELLRRDSTSKPNRNNANVDEIMQRFAPLTDSRDIAFIIEKETEIRQMMLDIYNELPESKRARIEAVNNKPKAEESPTLLQTNGSLTMYATEIVMAAAERVALNHKWKVAIAIVDAFGDPMLAKRVNEAFPASFEIALGKARASVQFNEAKNNGSRIGDIHDAAHGALAIMIDGVLRGGIGVSGHTAKLSFIAKLGITALTEAVAAAAGDISVRLCIFCGSIAV